MQVIRRKAKTQDIVVKLGARASVAVTMATFITHPVLRTHREIEWGKLMAKSTELVNEIGRMTALNVPKPSESAVEGTYAMTVHDYIRDLKRQNSIVIGQMQALEKLM